MALQNRPLRPFEQQAHLHVLDWAHETARYRFQKAGATQVKAAAKQLARERHPIPPPLPSLAHAITLETRKLYALGHATVRSELDAQRHGHTLTIGLSAAPAPPHLRKAKAKKGKQKACATCRMYDSGVCWGYGNYPVKPNQVCDSYWPDGKPKGPKQLAQDEPEPPEGPAMMRPEPATSAARGQLVSQAVSSAIHQAIAHGRLLGITSIRRLRGMGEKAGEQALGASASLHAGGAIMAGRHAAALQAGGEIIGARYTAVLDKNTCGNCAAADDGVLRPLDDPALTPAPNPDCQGGPRCRCIWVYQLMHEEPKVEPSDSRAEGPAA